jgi:hypothetical protein
VKQYVSAILLSLACCGAVRAAAIDLDNHRAAAVRVADLSSVPGHAVVMPPSGWISELPEPEVFAMMLVGLLLIGYRATRHSSEKFR